ncbi:unnamed protein product [Amoebophrya sp. A25]|nr:unnamed protein product [Amoebophrya sp. A25]|eukprot:GSA25T00014613001.1
MSDQTFETRKRDRPVDATELHAEKKKKKKSKKTDVPVVTDPSSPCSSATEEVPPPSVEVSKKKKEKKQKKATTATIDEATSVPSTTSEESEKATTTVNDEAAVGKTTTTSGADTAAAEAFRAEHHVKVSLYSAAGEGSASGGNSASTTSSTKEIACDVPDPVQSFKAAPFAKPVRKLLSSMFEKPSPIQAQVWSIVARGHDLVAIAKTGSGKTLAFLLPCFEAISAKILSSEVKKQTRLLVLAPTRELAVQIAADAEKFGDKQLSNGITTAVVYGGVPKGPQIRELTGGSTPPTVVVATPGRFVDLLTDKNSEALQKYARAFVKSVTHFAVDEADRMLEMGFEPQMREILKMLPGSPDSGTAPPQTLLFSATWPKGMRKLAAAYIRGGGEEQKTTSACSSSKDENSTSARRPCCLQVNVGETEELAANKAVKQEFFAVHDDAKDGKLWKILDGTDEKADKVIVFANTKRRIAKLSGDVWASGYKCAVLSGDMTQADRDKGLADFAQGRVPLLFGTDVCARGLDIKGVTHVINYDMARDVESYIHRIGRTARAGEKGTSITFVNEDYDLGCSPALVKIAREAGQDIPEWLQKMADKSAKSGKKVDKLWKY